jgi:2-keto-3-deoxy-L-rhamnonate aldolase
VSVKPATFEILAAHPNIVGCKLSHGDVSTHTLVAANPKINHKAFHTFTGLGQQLLPVLTVGGAGAIDGLAGFYPRTVVRLFELYTSGEGKREEMVALQYKISAAEEYVVKWGTVGIKEAISRVLSLGDRDGTRLPLHGGLPGGDAEWKKWEAIMAAVGDVEKSLS